jgi:hypothetical protein
MIETPSDAKTRDAYRTAHYERSRAFGQLFGPQTIFQVIVAGLWKQKGPVP